MPEIEEKNTIFHGFLFTGALELSKSILPLNNLLNLKCLEKCSSIPSMLPERLAKLSGVCKYCCTKPKKTIPNGRVV
jgi:hypothetical protein